MPESHRAGRLGAVAVCCGDLDRDDGAGGTLELAAGARRGDTSDAVFFAGNRKAGAGSWSYRGGCGALAVTSI